MSKQRGSLARARVLDRVPAKTEDVRAGTNTGGGLSALMESAAQEILAATYWFDPAPRDEPYPVTVRFSGRRLNVEGRAQARDRFVQDETIDAVIPGSGPISVTARVRDINPGEWDVTAQVLEPPRRGSRRREVETAPVSAGSPDRLAGRWRRRVPTIEPGIPLRTCPTPFARVPGVLPGIWGVLVGLGIIVALITQAVIISRDHLAVGPAFLVSLAAIVAGLPARRCGSPFCIGASTVSKDGVSRASFPPGLWWQRLCSCFWRCRRGPFSTRPLPACCLVLLWGG